MTDRTRLQRWVGIPAFLALVMVLLLPLPIEAQTAKYGETIEVRVATTDVVVTRNGIPVEGLTADDFELYVDENRQELAGLDEVRTAGIGFSTPEPSGPDAAPSMVMEERRRRSVIIFLDLYSLEVRRRNQVLASLHSFVREYWRDGDQAMLAVWDRRLSVPVTFTTNLGRIEQEMEKVLKRTGSGLSNDRQIAQARIRGELQAAEFAAGRRGGSVADYYAAALGAASSYAEEQARKVRTLSTDMDEVMRGASGIEGKKLLIFVGENFPEHPGLGMYEYVNETFEQYRGTIRMAVPQMMATRLSLTNLTLDVVKAANATDITLHSIFTGESDSDTPVERESNAMGPQFAEFTNTAGSLAVMSRDTGGVALLGSRNFKNATEQIAREIASYYTLAWNVTGPDSKERRIDVRTKDRSLSVRTRRQFVAKSVEDEISDRVISQLFQENAADSRDVQVKVGASRRAGVGRITVPLEITFPSSLLTLVPQEGKQSGGFAIVVASSDQDNRLSEVSRKDVDASWLDGKVPPSIQYTMEMVMRNRPGMISVAVIDGWSKTPSYRRIMIPR